MAKKNYYANYQVNNGSSLMQPIEDTSLSRIKKDIIEIAKGNIFKQPHNSGVVYVEDEYGKEIYRAIIYLSKNLRPYVREVEV